MAIFGGDVEALREAGLTVDVHENGPEHLVVVRGYNVPRGKYWQESVDILVRVPQAYPQAKLDMFWVDPPLVLAAGTEPKATQVRTQLLGRAWQRWSRHYKWNPRHNTLLTHWAMIEQCLLEATP